MLGHTDHLMPKEAPTYFAEGMVNYNRVAQNLGLIYKEDWIGKFGHDMESHAGLYISHDLSPLTNGDPDDGCWAYLNTGMDRIAELLYPKYYIEQKSVNMEYLEFQSILLGEIAGLAEAGMDIPDEGGFRNEYDLKETAEAFDLEFPDRWFERFTKYVVENDLLHENQNGKFSLTQKGMVEAKHKFEDLGYENYVLATQGEGKLFFSVDASHISRLGLELVAKQETAVAELVKNGYDADATNVDLIVNTESEVTTLEIMDNGSGMSLSELEDGFMRLSTQEKVNEPISKKYKRQRAGRKGIGRFAAQRLGKYLMIETTTSESEFGISLEIDWEMFGAQKNISQVPCKVKRIPKPFEHGTRLTIKDLRDNWSDAQIFRAYKHIGELIQPFPLAEKTEAMSIDPGFRASFARELDDDFKIIADDWQLYFKHAIAEIEGHVDENGQASWSLKSKKFKIDINDEPISSDRNNPNAKYKSLNSIKFKAYYYIDKEIQRSLRGEVGKKLQSDGGIRLYRNGFRVLPYGERYDDWLKLNASNLMRSILPPHSNRNFLGFVEINDVDGQFFEETSAREGLLENESFLELKDFISSTLKTAVQPIATARNKESTTTKTRQERRTPQGQAKEILDKLESLQNNASEDSEYAKALKTVVQSIQGSIVDLGESGESILQELEMMRVLASLGITIGEFTHEVGISLEAIKASVNLVKDNAFKDKSIGIMNQINDFEGYLNYFDKTVRDNVSREVRSIEIRDVVKPFLKVLAPKISRQNLEVSEVYEDFSLFMKPMHKSEWSSILINFFTNSLKAIQRAGVQGKIAIRCGRSNNHIFLEFMDNGDGIPEKNKTAVFDAFYTTTAAIGVGDNQDTMSGMGLGLKIVQDIVTSASGKVFIKPAADGYCTCFRVEIPEATEEEIPDDAY